MLLHQASVCVAVNVRSLVTALHFYSASSAFECNPGKSKDSLVGKFNYRSKRAKLGLHKTFSRPESNLKPSNFISSFLLQQLPKFRPNILTTRGIHNDSYKECRSIHQLSSFTPEIIPSWEVSLELWWLLAWVQILELLIGTARML